MRYHAVVEVDCDTREQAEQVFAERLGYDEDYGFPYTLEWDVVVISEADNTKKLDFRQHWIIEAVSTSKAIECPTCGALYGEMGHDFEPCEGNVDD